MSADRTACEVCFRHCAPPEGQNGFCGARRMKCGEMVSDNYGKITSLALDPIEKKPLSRFMPGSLILSVGSYGCNLRCPFCQNSEISIAPLEEKNRSLPHYEEVTPDELADAAEELKSKGNIGLAFTYNEPMIGYEFVRDTARKIHQRGMVNVLVTNGTAGQRALEEVLPYIDAMNVDLKGFSMDYYRELGGDLAQTMGFIETAAKSCHIEVTTLVVPGENDSDQEMRKLSSWLASLECVDDHGNTVEGRDQIALHVTRFFPRYHMAGRKPTGISSVYHLANVARENLRHVYTGNC